MFPTTLTRSSNGHVRRILIATLAALLLFTTLALIPGAPLGADPAHATSTVTPITDFEIDGNLIREAGGDWQSDYGPGLTANDSYPTTGIYYNQRNTDVCALDTDDVAAKSPAVKLADGPTWRTTTGAPNPGKGDLKAVWVGAEKIDVSGQLNDMLYLAFELCNAPNSEFQVALALEGPDRVPPFDPADTPTGSTDDLLIVFNFTPSTGTATALIHTFDGTQWSSSTTSIPGTSWEASILPGGTVGEIAINLTTAGILPENACRTVSVSDQVATINGNSLTSGVNDIVAVEPLEIATCGTLEVEKVSEPDVPSAGPFEYVVAQVDLEAVSDSSLNISGVHNPINPVPPAASDVLSAAIHVGEVDTWGNVISERDYTIEELVEPTGWAIAGLSCTFTDIFQPGLPTETVVIHDGTQYVPGAQFLIPPDTFPPGATTPTKCTITNATSGVIVEKVGAGDPSTVFPFDINGEKLIAGGLQVDGLALSETSDTMTFTPGTSVTVSETFPVATPAWTHTSTTCLFDDGSPVTVTGGLNPTFDTVAGKVITCTFENDQAALIIVEKQTLPDGSSQAFAFAGTELNSTGIHDGETIEAEVDPGGPYTSTEVVPHGWDLTDISCDDPNSSGDVGTKTATFNVVAGQTVKCTFTNTETPTLQLVKTVTKDHGGTAVPDDWDLTAASQGFDPSRDIDTKGGSGAVEDVFADTVYDLAEANGPAGYTPGAWTCVGGAQNGPTIELAPGESSVCTIDNDDDPASLLLIKDVVNDNGGTAVASDWTLFAGAYSVTGSDTAVEVTDQAGTYALTESGVPDYTNTSITCSDAPDVEVTEVTIGIGETKTCTFVNDDDAPSLLLIKDVVNDNGGIAVAADWTLYAGTESVTGSGTAVEVTDQAGTYKLTESGVPDYANTSITCDNAPDGVEVTDVTIEIGQTITCTFVNDDDPASLILIKEVVNDNGGSAAVSDWTLYIEEGTTAELGVKGSTAGHEITNQAGTYDLSESVVGDYTNTSITCDNAPDDFEVTDVTIEIGETITCTFINDDDPAGLILVKEVVNDNGGTAVASDWTLYAGTNDVPGSETGELATDVAGTYALTETGVPDYTNTSITCSDNPGAEVTEVTIGIGETKTCTFVNDDDAPSLLLIKDVVNDNGGIAVAADWTLSAGADSVTGSDTAVEVTDQAGTYALTESGVPGYTNTSITCDNTPGEVTEVTIGLGQRITCTFVNDDDPASLILIKEVVNDNGGSAAVSDWTLYIEEGTTDELGVIGSTAGHEVTDQAGTYALTETGVSGYSNTSLTCDNTPGEVTDVTIEIGQTITCTFVNDDLLSSITLVKTGAFGIGDDGLANPGDVITYEFEVTNDGETPLTDIDVTDFDLGGINVSCPKTELAVGESMTCTADYPVTRDDINAGTIHNCALAAGLDSRQDGVSDEDCFDTDIPQAPAIDITKDVVPAVINVGEATTVTWTIEVSNTGNVPLHDVAVTDALVAACDRAIGDLALGGSTTYTCNSTHTPDNLAWTFTNVAVTTGVGPLGTTVTAEDDATIDPIEFLGTAQGGDTVWLDKNKNGVQDADEPGINGAKVILKDAAGNVIATMITAKGAWDGSHILMPVSNATYTFELDKSSVSGQLTTASSFTVTIVDGEDYTLADFGVAEVLPVTGMDSAALALVGLAMLAAGAMAILFSRRKREDG